MTDKQRMELAKAVGIAISNLVGPLPPDPKKIDWTKIAEQVKEATWEALSFESDVTPEQEAFIGELEDALAGRPIG